ncbi:MAG: hypothetical protein A2X05_11720 [Bacteroidetes bacterium GWE2_41_25]|nr:MAG: hypothetical protein A2X03_11450 [Bacteroidetes bacterium GWA2_40_15]OFY04979.1 MAG: hypothetical protein A2X05_11720 [Bacteroidetes bacterium GWE2_41_25]OFY59000.1 MAG: hypothetical protein A2X04_08145 [Bacteroidetes bacterium GWF2_41_9]HAM10127.1 hypothetical protein [Bacteroidales bacterium]HBH84208.1 hypothetical protein [Bacteroidales bacterium]
MKLKIFPFLLLFISVAFSCKKDDEMMIPDMVKVPVIKSVRDAEKPQYEYVYNYSRLISEEKSKYSYTNYNYNEQNQLVTTDYYINEALLSTDQNILEAALNQQGLMSLVSTEKGGTLRYEYNASGRLTKTIAIRPAETTSEYSEYNYDDNDRIGREILYWDNKILGYIEYEYDERGNLIHEVLFSITSSGLAEINTTTEYEFDNKQNPYRSVQRILSPGINTNLNNIVKEIYTIHIKPDDGENIVQVTSFAYVYSSLGFPVRKNSTVEYIYE